MFEGVKLKVLIPQLTVSCTRTYQLHCFLFRNFLGFYQLRNKLRAKFKTKLVSAQTHRFETWCLSVQDDRFCYLAPFSILNSTVDQIQRGNGLESTLTDDGGE